MSAGFDWPRSYLRANTVCSCLEEEVALAYTLAGILKRV